MSIVAKALWYIELHFANPALTLDDVARACGASRFHLTRAFGAATGRSLMRYLRARRMTEAAHALAAGAGDILAVALEAGYGSHEAFTRAFREQFGVTPESVRARGSCAGLELVEAIRLDPLGAPPLGPARIVERPGFRIAGLRARYTYETAAGIPALWQRLMAHPAPHNRVGRDTYGVALDADSGAFGYVCGVEVEGAAGARLPEGYTLLFVPAARYAVFFHAAHISAIRMTWRAIFEQVLPQAGLRAVRGPQLERYDERYDAATGNGGVELWVPVAPAEADA